MKDLSIYYEPVELDLSFEDQKVGNHIDIHIDGFFPKIKSNGIALIFTPESRMGDCHKSSDSFRKHFYDLYLGNNWQHSIYDLGTIKPGKSIQDTLHALESSVTELVKNRVIPIIIGGSQDLTMGIYKSYEHLEQFVNLTTVDHSLDLGNVEKDIEQEGWLSHILLEKPCYLFNYSNIGAQQHFIAPKTFELFEELYFDILRLGKIKSNIQLSEPVLRNTDILSFDLRSIVSHAWNSDYFNNPNGIEAHDACTLMRYAGISDKLTCLGLFNQELNENENQSGPLLIAQLIWYFNEGFANRKGDFPIGSKKSYTKFRVYLEEINEEIVFSKSDKSARWWMEVPYPSKSNSKFLRHYLVPCSYETYQEAMKGEIPDLWWKTYQKIS